MFRSQARPCYPENSPADGCFPENDTTPSRFKCWVDGSPDGPRPADLLSPDTLGADLLSLFSPRDQPRPAPRRGSHRGRK
jgi:hypothetical protein